jgi:hypothetical protein
MQVSDPRVTIRTPLILNDELWNLADGVRTLEGITLIVSYEFGLNLEAAQIEMLARGLERAGYLHLKETLLVEPHGSAS